MFYPFRFHSNYFRFRVFKRQNFFWVFLESLADEYFTTDNWLTTIWLSPPYPSSRTSKNSTPCSSSFLTVTLSTDFTKPKNSQIEFPHLAAWKYRKSFFKPRHRNRKSGVKDQKRVLILSWKYGEVGKFSVRRFLLGNISFNNYVVRNKKVI